MKRLLKYGRTPTRKPRLGIVKLSMRGETIIDGNGGTYTSEQATELIRIGMAETRETAILEMLGINPQEYRNAMRNRGVL